MESMIVVSDPVRLAVSVALIVMAILCGLIHAVALGWLVGVRHRVILTAGAKGRTKIVGICLHIGAAMAAAITATILWMQYPTDPFIAAITALLAVAAIIATAFLIFRVADEITRLRQINGTRGADRSMRT